MDRIRGSRREERREEGCDAADHPTNRGSCSGHGIVAEGVAVQYHPKQGDKRILQWWGRDRYIKPV